MISDDEKLNYIGIYHIRLNWRLYIATLFNDFLQYTNNKGVISVNLYNKTYKVISKQDPYICIIFMFMIDTLLDSIIHLWTKDSNQAHDVILTGHAEINQKGTLLCS